MKQDLIALTLTHEHIDERPYTDLETLCSCGVVRLMHERTSINIRVNAGWKYHPASRDTVYVDGDSYMLDTACSQPLRRRSEIMLIVHVARIVLQVCKHVLRLIQLSLVIMYPSCGVRRIQCAAVFPSNSRSEPRSSSSQCMSS